MHRYRIDRFGWRGLVVRRCVGLGLTLLGLALGTSFWAHAEDASPTVSAGPTVVLTLAQGGKIRGALLEFRDGKVRIKPEGEAERALASADVIDVNFAPEAPAVAQVTPATGTQPAQVDPSKERPTDAPTEPKTGPLESNKPPDAQPKDEPKRPMLEPFWKRRQTVEERRKKILEFIKLRIEERLAPDERKRFHELMKRETKLTPAERKELETIRQKLGLLDSDAVRRLVGEVLNEARQAQRKGELAEYNDAHIKRLRTAMTNEERLRHIASVFAGTRVNAPKSVPPLKDLAVNLMLSTNAPRTSYDEHFKDLRAMYELFCVEVDRFDTPIRPR